MDVKVSRLGIKKDKPTERERKKGLESKQMIEKGTCEEGQTNKFIRHFRPHSLYGAIQGD